MEASLRWSWWIGVCLFVLLSTPLLADGKMYMTVEKVPVSIPYQRAAILFDKGQETLILQSQYQIPGESSQSPLGWVVPIPSVPEIDSMYADTCEFTFFRLDMMTRPDVTSIREILIGVFYISWFSCLCIIPLLWIISKIIRRAGFYAFIQRAEKPLRYFLWSGLVFFFLLCLGATAGRDVAGVEVLKSQKAGIHDVTVIRAASVQPLLEWLDRNGFHHGPEDTAAFESYIRRGWCFATSKVDSSIDPKKHSAVMKNLLAPLVLRFPVSHPVYPTALTATAGHDTEILIYLASNMPLETKSPIELRYRGARQYTVPYYLKSWASRQADQTKANDFKYMSKYKSTLTPAQMATDIEFTEGPEREFFREHVIRF